VTLHMLLSKDDAGDYMVSSLSTGWSDLLGVGMSELVSMPLTTLIERFVHPDDVEGTQQAAGALLVDASAVVDFVNRYRTPDGWATLTWHAFAFGGDLHATATVDQ